MLSASLDLGLNAKPATLESTLYEEWLKSIKSAKTGYFLLSNKIEEYLPLLTTPSIKLYLFYAIHADNKTGESFYSTEKIAQLLDVSKKTITNWNRELANTGLISRKQEFNKSSLTQLLPTSNCVIEPSNDIQEKKIIAALESVGYKSSQSINNIITKNNKNTAFTCKLYTRTYSNPPKDKSQKKPTKTLTRTIVLKKTSMPEYLDSITNQSNWKWINSSQDDLTIIWPDKEVIKTRSGNPSQKDLLELFDQLTSDDNILAFKKNFSEYKLT